jgi:Tellurite resistance protein TerB
MNPNLQLSAPQVLALTAAMLAVSHVDGVHPAETQLIQQFYEGSREGDMPAFADVQGSHPSAQELLKQLTFDTEFAEALVASCLMVAYADGDLTDNELATARGFASAYGVSTEQFDGELQVVRDALLGSLASLPDAASVAALAKEL